MRIVDSAEAAVSGIGDGSVVMIGGFGLAGQPVELIEALTEQGATDLTVINNNAGNGNDGLARLIELGRVRKIICSFPRQSDSWHFDREYLAGRLELELVPQGNLAERIRAAGAGIGAFYSPIGIGTLLAEGKETRSINGQEYLLEYPLAADFALIKAAASDRLGNLVYRKTARNFAPVMATAARTTIVQTDSLVPVGALDPEHIITPCIFTNTVVRISAADQKGAEQKGAEA